MNFADLLRNEAKWTKTENFADALNTTSNALLDMYGSLAAMRKRADIDLIRKFELAYAEDPLGALRCLFYVRDIRGGQGERDIFRTILRYSAEKRPEVMAFNLPCIPVYGRWDDLYYLIGTPVEEDMWKFVKTQLDLDIQDMEAGKPVSLLAKWLKKANSSNENTKKLGIYTAKKLGYSIYDYKRICSRLRKYLDVTEIKMSDGAWDQINYEHVPSRAMMIYRKAFLNHDQERFETYLAAVQKGEAKIHSGTLYPYDIVEKILYQADRSAVLDAQWNALPDYVQGGADFLVMADVSGSMTGRPMASSIALAIYFAERNPGAYHNLFMTFSANPMIVDLKGDNIFEKVAFLQRADWGYNTNFEAAMKLVLDVAVQNRCKQEDLPKALICVTDMEFDSASRSLDRKTYYQHIQEMFQAAGYDRAPTLVFWNVNARNDVFHGDSADEGLIMVAGQSASTFENLVRFLNGDRILTAVDFMYEVLNGERYRMVQLPN
jgi:hypothetical protein